MSQHLSTQRFSPNRLVVLAVLLAACGDRAPTEPSGVPGVYVAGVVRDPDGKPVPLITVTWEAWPAPDSVEQGAVSDFSARWSMRTDSTGRFAAHVGYYGAQLDSIEVGVLADACWGLAPLTVRERAVAVRPGTPDTVLNVNLTLLRTASRARLAVGAACAAMVGPPPFVVEDRFILWIDEISDSVRGRWLINYQATRGSDYGHFSGAREGSSLILDLRQEAGPPGGMCRGYTVELPVEIGDTLGIGTYRSYGCRAVPTPLRFVTGEPFAWPFE